MTYDEILAFMIERGYTLVWSNADKRLAGFRTERDGVIICAQVHADTGNAEVYNVREGVRITSDLFALDPTRMDKYECYVAKAALALGLCGV